MNEHTIRQIARVCHEVNRAYCQAIGDSSQPEWDAAEDWQVDSAVAGVRANIEALSEKGDVLSPQASHKSWLDQKALEGWRYGTVKDPEKRTHPCFVAYEFLPVEQRVKDYLFGAVIKSLASSENLL